MIELANFFSPSPTYTIFSVGIAAFLGFIIGFLLKSGVIAKHRKRVLNLEDEMLSNHSRILELEKQVTVLKEEKAKLTGSSSKAELKVS